MILTSAQELQTVVGGVEIFSRMGILILTIGIMFSVGLPLIMIFKGRKD